MYSANLTFEETNVCGVIERASIVLFTGCQQSLDWTTGLNYPCWAPFPVSPHFHILPPCLVPLPVSPHLTLLLGPHPSVPTLPHLTPLLGPPPSVSRAPRSPSCPVQVKFVQHAMLSVLYGLLPLLRLTSLSVLLNSLG